MQVVVSREAAALVRGRGGRPWVWAARPPGLSGLNLVSQAGVKIWFRVPAGWVPDVLEIGLHGRRRPWVEAYWDGCRIAL